jgi:DtxR family Mn-dependent transcriptional regulator
MIVPLSELKPGQSAQVAELKSDNPARLDRLGAFGLVPGILVRLEQAQPAFILRVGETEISVDKEVASEIVVLSAPATPSTVHP